MQYAFGDYVLDTQRYELHGAGKLVPLRPKAFEVLAYLVAHRERIISKAELLERLWSGQFVSDATVNSCIKEVRRAIGDRGAMPRLLRTVRGRGYRFVAPVTEAGQPRPEDVQPATPAPASPAAHEPRSPSTPAAAAALSLSPADVQDTGEEYKAVTALCLALVKAPALAERLGPEAMHQVMQAVMAEAQDVVRRYEGAIVHIAGEGFTGLFGAPMAQEDHARRAVLAALELRQRLHDHPAIRTHTGGEALAVRMGLHTGPAVVGQLPREPQQLYTAVGATTHLAARLQQRAAPGAILISAATHRLVQAEVRAEACAIREGDGRSPAALAYALQGLVQQRAGVLGWRGRPLSRFVGRAREMAVLQARLTLAAQGRGQVVGIAGEPGMGKSRLLYEFARSLRGRAVTYREAHCLAHGTATPYLVVRALLRQICGFSEADGPEAIAAKVQRYLQEAGAAWQDEAALLLELLDVSIDAPQLAALAPQARKARTFALLHRLTLHDGYRQPLVLAVENLHWIDATSEEWLAALVGRLAGAAILLLTTYRPGYRPPWLDKSYATQLALPGLTPADSLAVVQSVARAAPLPERLAQEIVAKAAGNPFFLEELTRSAMEAGGDAAPAIPDSVQAVLAARIDRLTPAEKRLLQTMAAIGKDAPVPLLRAVAALPEEVLYRGLDHLQAAEFLSEAQALPGPVYTFNHALIQEVAYQSLLRRARRDLHRRIAQTLAEHFPEVAATQPERLAHHYTEAGMHEPALDWWRRAGVRALERSAYVEAISHLEKGLAALQALPQTLQRLRQELDLQIALGPALSAAKGAAAPEVEQAYGRARVLCTQVGDTPQLFPTLRGLWRFYLNRGALSTAQELGERLLRLARREAERTPLLEAHEALGTTLFFRGEYAAARQHLEQSLALVDSTTQRHLALHRGLALGVTSLVYVANALWCLGYPTQAVQRCQEALALAEALAHPHSLAFARHYAAFLHYRRREASAVYKHAEATLTLATAQGLPLWAGLGQCMRGWAQAMEGHGEAGQTLLQQGLAAVLATGQGISRAACLLLWAEAAGQAGQVEAGLRLLAQAFEAFEASGRGDGLAEAYRLRGAFLLRQTAPDASQAEGCFQQAMTMARRQQAKCWELRAALSLARLWRQQGKHAEAQALLAPIYDWFTEGFDTADLQEAQMLLEDLSRERGGTAVGHGSS
ncbi:MAG TPA: AAA family ATPase [Alphaproteobacteria bacterium]|nr:AAA family ATPase [Alphaproteobacteria bacterium]